MHPSQCLTVDESISSCERELLTFSDVFSDKRKKSWTWRNCRQRKGVSSWKVCGICISYNQIIITVLVSDLWPFVPTERIKKMECEQASTCKEKNHQESLNMILQEKLKIMHNLCQQKDHSLQQWVSSIILSQGKMDFVGPWHCKQYRNLTFWILYILGISVLITKTCFMDKGSF